jgi:transposase
VRLNNTRRRQLRRLAQGGDGHVGFRARIVLVLEQDPCVARVARRLATRRHTVRLWRDRYLTLGVDGLKTCPRPGRPPEIDAVTRCVLLSIACGKPGDAGVLFRETWTTDTLHEALNAFQRGHGGRLVSRTSVLRILNEADIRPHHMSLWLHSPDPEFRRKVTEICDLYLSPPPGSVVLCVDEKTGMQALGRKHPSRPPEPGRDGRFEYEYVRNGTRALLAAFAPHTGHVIGQVCERRGAADLVAFMEKIARRYPTGEVHIVWDNLNIHFDGADDRWTSFNQRHGQRFHFHYTPIHASWVNQVELFLGILHKRLLRYGVYRSVDELTAAIEGFVAHWNRAEAHPFRWTFKGYPLQTGRAAA